MIRDAIKGDLNSIIDLWQEMMEFHIKKSDLYQMKPDAKKIYSEYLNDVLKSPDYVTLVFEDNNEVLGYLIATESNDPPVYEGTAGLILELSVTEKYRNKGIGEKLVSSIEKYFENKGIKRIECMVSDFNEISKGFWFKHGYNPYNLMCVKILR
ncbi:MAG TPA: GNAT family N-acetyltransferase [Methanobacterium sp.]|nr:GNAT family N-acetyltransferase [Methanobacterium sp.]